MFQRKEGMAVRPQGRLLLPFVCFWLLILSAPDSARGEERLLLSLENPAGEVIYSTPVQSGNVFGIRYRHSVALSPVTDYFIVKNDGIWLDRTVYQDFGAGLPHTPEGTQVMRSQDGHISISGFNRKLGSFQLRVGRVAHHVLLLMSVPTREQPQPPLLEIPLESIAKPGSAITFAVRRADPQDISHFPAGQRRYLDRFATIQRLSGFLACAD